MTAWVAEEVDGRLGLGAVRMRWYATQVRDLRSHEYAFTRCRTRMLLVWPSRFRLPEHESFPTWNWGTGRTQLAENPSYCFSLPVAFSSDS